MNRRVLFLVLLANLFVWGPVRAQQPSLTVPQIMQDPTTWIGAWPSQPAWAEDGQTLYFQWNPKGAFPSDSLFMVTRDGGEPAQVPPETRRTLGPTFDGWHHGEYVYDASFSRKVYARNGDLFIYHRDTNDLVRLTQTRVSEASPRFCTRRGGHRLREGGQPLPPRSVYRCLDPGNRPARRKGA